MNTNTIALTEQVKTAMRRAYDLGQRYWQQADSDFTSQHKKADETAAKFAALSEETCAAIAALEAEPPKQEAERDWSTAQDWKGMDGAIAWHLIDRHADGWDDVGAMMNAWLAAQAEPQGWRPISEAPKDGRSMLLGYPNRAGKWRTVRGQWFSDAEIAETWEEEGDEGWYETSVECEDLPNCWPIEPTHWMPLPATPPKD